MRLIWWWSASAGNCYHPTDGGIETYKDANHNKSPQKKKKTPGSARSRWPTAAADFRLQVSLTLKCLSICCCWSVCSRSKFTWILDQLFSFCVRCSVKLVDYQTPFRNLLFHSRHVYTDTHANWRFLNVITSLWRLWSNNHIRTNNNIRTIQ